MLTIFVVTEAEGETADRMVRTALSRFMNLSANIVRCSYVSTPKQIRDVVSEAANQESLIFHTLTSEDLRRHMLTEVRANDVDSMDVMGLFFDRLRKYAKLEHRKGSRLVRHLVETRSRQIEAVEFAFRHDDGQWTEELRRAEVVLVGASRVMKTPTSLYLAYRGWFAANVPILLRLPPPEALLSLHPERVFCLYTTPQRLLELRLARAEAENIPEEPYASLRQIRSELIFSRQLSHDRGWREVDVTGRSVEEVAHEIIMLLPKKVRRQSTAQLQP